MVHNDYYVYVHRKADTNEVFYVGKGRSRRAYEKGTRRNDYWNRTFAIHGRNIEFIEQGLTEVEAFKCECELIDLLKKEELRLCNLTDGGEGSSGHKHTEEDLKKMSESQKGKTMTDEHKANMRKPKSEEGRAAIAEAQRKLRASGYKPSEESNNKRSKTLMGRTSPMKGVVRSEESKKKQSESLIGRVLNRKVCTHCNRDIPVNVIERFHNDNCKMKEVV